MQPVEKKRISGQAEIYGNTCTLCNATAIVSDAGSDDPPTEFCWLYEMDTVRSQFVVQKIVPNQLVALWTSTRGFLRA